MSEQQILGRERRKIEELDLQLRRNKRELSKSPPILSETS
jgi:hypothetical protein